MICLFVLLIELLLARMITLLTGSLDTTIAIGFIFLFTIAYFFVIFTKNKYRTVRKPLFCGYLLRQFFFTWDFLVRGILTLPGSGADTEHFWQSALYYAKGMIEKGTNGVTTFGTMVRLFGDSRVFIQFLLMLFSIATLHVIYRILIMAGLSKRNICFAMWFAALLPNYAIMSVIFLRESMITFCVSLSLFCFVGWWVKKKDILFFMSFVTVFVGALYHSGIVAIAVGYIIIRFLYDKKTEAFKLNFTSIIVSILFLLAFVFLFNNYGSRFFSKMQRIEDISDIASGSGRGNSSYAAIAGDSSTITSFIRYTPIRVFLFLFTPLFFQIRGYNDLIAMLFSAFFYLWVWIRSIKYLSHNTCKKTLMISLLIIALVVAFVFGWGSTNVGTNLRHRDKLIPLYILMLGLSNHKELKTKETYC